jgi:mannose-6-phosphate isomerase-like protein (cupin superfamily)
MPDSATAHIGLETALEAVESAGGARFVELFRHGTLSVELYVPRGHDPQTPHSRDEVYVIASGRGVFFDGEARRPFSPGTLLFVAAARAHRFEDFSEDFAAWVLFYGPEGGEAG